MKYLGYWRSAGTEHGSLEAAITNGLMTLQQENGSSMVVVCFDLLSRGLICFYGVKLILTLLYPSRTVDFDQSGVILLQVLYSLDLISVLYSSWQSILPFR